MTEKYCDDKFFIIFFGEEKMKVTKDKRMIRIILFSIQNYLFGHIFFRKISTFIFLVHGYSSRSTFGLHLVKVPKTM